MLLEEMSINKLLGLLDITVISISRKFAPELTKQQENSLCHSVRCTFLEVLTSETHQDPSKVFEAIRNVIEMNV